MKMLKCLQKVLRADKMTLVGEYFEFEKESRGYGLLYGDPTIITGSKSQ
jgi:hypothetical protein